MKRSLIVKICTVAVILGIAACMFVIGRGHTVYFDAKPIEYNGESLEPGYRTAIFVNGERVARLSAGDRGMATLNMPALIAGAPEEVYLSEFVSLATEVTVGGDEEIVTDDFGIGGDI